MGLAMLLEWDPANLASDQRELLRLLSNRLFVFQNIELGIYRQRYRHIGRCCCDLVARDKFLREIRCERRR